MQYLQENDPAVAEMKRIVTTELYTPVEFLYANMGQVNFGLDQIELADNKPVWIFFATDKSQNETTQSGLIIRTIPVVGMMLQLVDNPTTDYNTEEVSPYIYSMQQLTDKLIYQLNKSQLTYQDGDKYNGIDKWNFDKVYAKYDKHLFGGAVTFNWPFNTMRKGC